MESAPVAAGASGANKVVCTLKTGTDDSQIMSLLTTKGLDAGPADADNASAKNAAIQRKANKLSAKAITNAPTGNAAAVGTTDSATAAVGTTDSATAAPAKSTIKATNVAASAGTTTSGSTNVENNRRPLDSVVEIEDEREGEDDEEETRVEDKQDGNEEREEDRVRTSDAPIDSPLEQIGDDDYAPPHGFVAVVGKVFGFLLFWIGNGFLIFYLVPKIVMTLMGKP